ncbi:MAG: hypothetical protein QW228_09540 [Candidatus Aenigmatarchaeota archaeon]
MVTLSLKYILFAAVACAVLAAVLLFVSSRWLDIQGYRYQLDTQRITINMLNLILSNSPIVERFSEDDPNRLILNSKKLDILNKDDWEKNFDLLEFDYNLTIIDLVNNKKWSFSNIYFGDSECYYESMRISGYADVPVVISYGKEKHPGKASLNLRKTPLSELAFRISEGFMRDKMGWGKYIRGIRIDTTQVKGVEFLDDKICLKKDSENFCKYIFKGDANLVIDESVKSFPLNAPKCIDIIVEYDPDTRTISVKA